MCDITVDKVYFRGIDAIYYFIENELIPKCKEQLKSSGEFTFNTATTNFNDGEALEIEVEVKKGKTVRYIYMQFERVANPREPIYLLDEFVVFDENGQQMVADELVDPVN